jgi:hypothetical protein
MYDSDYEYDEDMDFSDVDYEDSDYDEADYNYGDDCDEGWDA